MTGHASIVESDDTEMTLCLPLGIRRTLIMLTVLGTISSTAYAQDRNICLERDGQRSIEACGRLIASGQLTGKDLATIFVVRATIFRGVGSYDHAIDDMTHAVELLRGTASTSILSSAYVTRGSFYSLSGDLVKALDDYRRALALDGANAQAAEEMRILQAQLALVAPSEPENHTARQIAVPNEPLPAEIPIPAAVLELVQTNPFFANAPPVRIGGFNVISSVSTSTSAGGGPVLSNNEDQEFVTWLRRGLTRTDSSSNSATTNIGRTEDGSGHTAQILAANGFISLGSKGVSQTSLGTSTTIDKTIRIGNLSGHVFPIEVGNEFSYERTSEQRSTLAGTHYHAQSVWGQHCTVSKTLDAKFFHPDLTGLAYVTDCLDRLTTSVSTLESPSRTIFFSDLGYWISVDPVVLKEQMISNGAIGNGVITTTGMRFKTSSTGIHTLQSFSRAR